MIDPSTVQDEKLRQLLREQERDRRQAILDTYMERKFAAEEAEREYQRRLKRELDPFDWGHWGPGINLL
jgi:hypothetical protein